MEARRLHVLLERLSNVLREDLRQTATAHGLKLVQLEALQYLVVANRFSDTLSGLTAWLGATKGTVSQTLKALDAKGLIVRQPDPDDGRVSHLRLTEAGRAIAEEAMPASVLRTPGVDGSVDAIEQVLRSMLHGRQGVAFGVCRTCRHHQPRWCALLEVELVDEDGDRWCREHVAA